VPIVVDTTKPKLSLKTILLPIVGLVAFFLYILLFNVDIQEIIAKAQTADPVIYSAAIAVSLAEVFFYAVSWRALLSYLKVKISVIRSYLFVWYGIFMDIIIPAESISGELCRVYLVNREQCGTGGKVIASVVTQRIIGMGMNIVFLIVGIVLLFTEAQVSPLIFNLILFFTVAIAAIMVLLLLVSAKENWSLKVINALIRAGEFLTRGKWKKLAQFKEEAIRDAKIFHDSMKEFIHKPKMLVLPTVLLALNWICSLSVPYLVFLSLNFPIPWSVVLITSAIVVAVKSIPIGVPFEVGLPEITMTTLYTSMLGIDQQIATICATATILSRILTLWLRFGIGFAAQQWIELKPVLIPANCAPKEKT
jgi:uncharacterized protein (TIRG00374 family)